MLARMFLHLFSVAFLLQAHGRPIQVTAEGAQMLRREPQDAHRDDGAAYALVDSGDSTPSPAPPPGGITCVTNQVAYVVLTDGLALIDMGPVTMSGKTEVRRLTSTSNYDTFKEDYPIETRLHTSASDNDVGEWSFLADGNDNIIAVNCGLSDSNMTEVHRLKYDQSSPYQEFDLGVVTALPHKTSFDEWEFLLDSSSNLVVIKKGPTTDSAMTELHMLAATESWQNYTIGGPSQNASAATGLHLSSSMSNWGEWTFLLDAADNLICIRRPNVGDNSITVKRLTAGSNYQSFSLENGGATLPEDSTGDAHWVFQMDPSDDLLCIKEGPITAEGYTEIHRLSMASDYQTFTLDQKKTAAPCRKPHYMAAAGTR